MATAMNHETFHAVVDALELWIMCILIGGLMGAMFYASIQEARVVL